MRSHCKRAPRYVVISTLKAEINRNGLIRYCKGAVDDVREIKIGVEIIFNKKIGSNLYMYFQKNYNLSVFQENLIHLFQQYLN